MYKIIINMTYPTTEKVKKNILNEEEFKETYKNANEILNTIKEWKDKKWTKDRKKNKFKKWFSIAMMAKEISSIINKKEELTIIIEEETDEKYNDETSFYNEDKKTIKLKGTPSIITALHEISHHCFGKDEFKACVFSI
jgi:hypothetical protein